MFRQKLIFLSYSGERRQVEEIAYALRRRRYEVFFDGWSLFQTFDIAMNVAARRCSLFVLFVSPRSMRRESACLNELSYVKDRDVSRRVLLIDHDRVGPENLPARPAKIEALQVHSPTGNFVVGVVDEIVKHCKPGITWAWSTLLTWAGASLLLGLAIFLAIAYYERTGTPLTTDQRLGLTFLVTCATFALGLIANGFWYLTTRFRGQLSLAGRGAAREEETADQGR